MERPRQRLVSDVSPVQMAKTTSGAEKLTEKEKQCILGHFA